MQDTQTFIDRKHPKIRGFSRGSLSINVVDEHRYLSQTLGVLELMMSGVKSMWFPEGHTYVGMHDTYIPFVT
jgi:hypothetical protein